MVKKFILEQKNKKYLSKEIEMISDPKTLAPIINPLGWKILNILNKKPQYASELARELKIHEQKVYYHINQLRKNNIIEIVKEEEKHGALCKYFAPTSKAFGIELPSTKTEIKFEPEKVNLTLQDFFFEFTNGGRFQGQIVVGSPLEHGPYMTAARDGHYAIHLSMLLGNMCKIEKEFVVKLDTDIIAEKEKIRNLIVIGGPVTNIVTAEINKHLKINFKWEKTWQVIHKNKKYTDNGLGLIVKIKNPWNPKKKIILLAGRDFLGTKSCILGLTNFYEEILKGFNNNKDFYAIVKGQDSDGDGKIDKIKIIEKII